VNDITDTHITLTLIYDYAHLYTSHGHSFTTTHISTHHSQTLIYDYAHLYTSHRH